MNRLGSFDVSIEKNKQLESIVGFEPPYLALEWRTIGQPLCAGAPNTTCLVTRGQRFLLGSWFLLLFCPLYCRHRNQTVIGLGGESRC
jgi:hypothetical protein